MDFGSNASSKGDARWLCDAKSKVVVMVTASALANDTLGAQQAGRSSLASQRRRQFGAPMRWPGLEASGYNCVVTDAAQTLLEQALTLPVQDRALLASGLLASLDSESLDETEVEGLWSAETERRATLLASGDAELVTWEHLVSRIDERRQ